MKLIPRLILAAVMLALAGCAQHRSTLPPPQHAPGQIDSASLSLDEIEPRPVLPRPRAVKDGPAPLEAISLFAQARGAMLKGRHEDAVALLEQAIRVDPDSFELYFALAESYLALQAPESQIIEALEQAAAIRPGDVKVQSLLGRQHLAAGDLSRALHHLRLARQTQGYHRDDGAAAMIDFALGGVLQQGGYDRAALEQYQAVLRRLRRPGIAVRSYPELMFLAGRLEIIHLRIALLHERNREYAGALRSYEMAAERLPADLELQAQVVRMLLELDRHEAAARRTAELVARFRGRTNALALLDDVAQQMEGERPLREVLWHLHEQEPANDAVAFALAQMLRGESRRSEAEQVLLRAIQASDGEFEAVRRLFEHYAERDEVQAAARLLIEALAVRPQALREMNPLWADLLRFSRRNRLRLPQLQGLEVDARAEASRLYWISRVAALWNREDLARRALEQSIALQPPFEPSYRLQMNQLWSRADLEPRQKIDGSSELAALAARHGRADLAAEVRGLSLLNQQQPAAAAEALAEAIELAEDPAPELLLAHALTLRMQEAHGRFEQVLWRLVEQWPTFEEAYVTLFGHYAERGSAEQAVRVLRRWLAEDPAGVNPRLLQVSVLVRSGQIPAAEQTLLELFAEHGENADVLAAMQSFYTHTGRADELIGKLEDQRLRQPENREVVDRLVDVYLSRNRVAEAMRVLADARRAAGRDADVLYYLAHLYQRIGQAQAAEEILEEVVTIDPTHAPASNDLGYAWAEQGRNLERAEALIRVAVEAEPDNQAFLDSLGWVLYKREQFEQAQHYLQKAVAASSRPDPVILDHLGDVQYRLGWPDEAQQSWREALNRLQQTGGDREDLRQLRLELNRKLKQVEQEQPVSVAPTGEASAG